jgi:fructan beta-fructosidase
MKNQLLTYYLLLVFTSNILAQEDQIPTLQWRPVYHFTPLKNWTNDPNGLIYIDGVYHLYNQQNPFENKWGHMSWGHATSKDLVHWNHLPIAIPETIDKDTTWRFSGCAVWDKNNTSGFCKGKNCIVTVYTADQPNLKKESQFIAYSNDGGITYTNYAGNPVIDLHKKDFRDPNVSWNEELKQWLMVVALPTEHKVRFYSSHDLKNWNMLSDFGPQGYIHAAWECPFLIRLPVQGKPSIRKWVLMISAAGAERGVYMQYFVGDFDGTTFKNDSPSDTILTVDYGDCFYAAIPWNNLPGDKKTFIGWMVPGPQETYPWRGQMSIPRDLSLIETKNGLRLIQQPASAIQNNLTRLSGNSIIKLNNWKIANGKNVLDKLKKISGNAYWLDAVFSVKPGTNFGFRIGQEKNKDNKTIAETIVGYNALSNQLYIDRSLSGNAKMSKDKLIQVVEVETPDSLIRMQILFDKSSLEVFFNNGEKVLTTYIFPGKGADILSAFATGGSAILKSLTIWDLSIGSKK